MIDKLLVDFLLAYMIENKTIIIGGLLLLAKEVLEYWLGRTDKVQAGSTLELIILFIKKVKNVIKG
jgi:hypothetical protein